MTTDALAPPARRSEGHRQAALLRYGLATLSVGTALLLGLFLRELDLIGPTAILLAAVAIGAWFAGLAPGLMGAVLATLAIDYFFTPPIYSFNLRVGQIPHVLVFALLAALSAWGSVARKRAEDSLRAARDELDARVLERTAELARANDALLRQAGDLRESERRYKHIFQTAGVSIWEEDFSRVKAAIDDLKAQGVVDVRRYCDANPDFVRQAVGMVTILDVNDATIRLFGARSKEELLVSLHRVFTPQTREVFKEELVAVAEGRTFFESETVLRTLAGDALVVLFTISFPPDPSTFDSVLVSIMDITARKRAERTLEQLAGRLIHAQEEERRRVGRELHDHVVQRLGILAITIDQFRQDPALAGAVPALDQLQQQTSEITDDVRSVSHRLHSTMLEYLGLVPAMSRLVAEFSERYDIEVRFAPAPLPAPVSPDVSLCLFRVAEESLTNVAKHSGAHSARMELAGDADGLRLAIEDSGHGFDPTPLNEQVGLGFVSMRERLRLVHGTLRIDSAPSHGTRISVWVPLEHSAPP